MDNLILDIILDALKDTLFIVPFLILTFYLIDFTQHRFGQNAKHKLYHLGRWGPFYGALLGSLPQCGFSIIASTLFIERVITPGTLIAVYIATSDEAIPILIANPEVISTVFPLISLKILVGFTAGGITDLLWKRYRKLNIKSTAESEEEQKDYGQKCITEGQISHSSILRHALKHTRQIAVFIFVATILLNFIFVSKEAATFTAVFKQSIFIQPVLTAIFGLIPNCATSVIITQAFVLKTISFGALFSGLSSNAGLGLLILFKKSKYKLDAIKVVLIVLAASMGTGVVLNFLFR